MPRKKVDRVSDILNYIETELYPAVAVVVGLIKTSFAKRTAAEGAMPGKTATRRRKAKPVEEIAATPPAEPVFTPTPSPVAQRARRNRTRRIRADSPPPVNEATPIVPIPATVGEDGGDEAYTGD